MQPLFYAQGPPVQPSTSDHIKERLRSQRLGFGAASLGNLYEAVADDIARETVDAAWQEGVRYFDAAPFYGAGLAERRLGDALRQAPRENWLLSTKVGRLLHPVVIATDRDGFRSPMPFEPIFDYSYDGVMRSFEDSLQRLGLARIDILYMHDIGRFAHGAANDTLFPIAMDGGYRALDALRSAGVIGAIGLGVNEIAVCERSFAYADFDLFMLAGRYTLLDQTPLQGFFDACLARGVGVVAAGIFNSGILATGTQGRGIPHFDYQPATPDIIARVARIEAICQQYGVSLPAAALQFSGAHPAVLTTVIGTANPARIRDTARLVYEKIPAAFWDELRAQQLLRADAPVPV